jgi:hypothetical protein
MGFQIGSEKAWIYYRVATYISEIHNAQRLARLAICIAVREYTQQII